MADLDALRNDLTARYALGASLGAGAFGAVHRARDLGAGREVAIKLLHERRVGGAALDRFLREATVAATLEHPGIVRVHAVGVHGGRPAIVYELVDGETLSAATRTLPLRARVELVRDAARAVGVAHARGVVHRDLKPDNLLVGRDGRLRVADFGLALFEGADRLTKTGALVGTPSYMAPELFADDPARRFTPASDVWALGVILYEALTGRLPFSAVDLVALMGQLQAARVEAPRAIDPAVDRAVEAVCLRALERDPERRYPDAGALAQALDDALAGRLATGGGSPRRVLATAAVLLLALLGAATWWSLRDPPAAVPAPPPAPRPHAAPRPTQAQAAPAAPARPVRLERTLHRGAGPVQAAWWDDRRLLTCARRGGVHLWDVGTGDEVRSWPVQVTTAGRAAGRVLLGAADGALLAFSPPGVEAPARVAALPGDLRDIAGARDAPFAVVLGLQEPGRAGRRAFLVDLRAAPATASELPHAGRVMSAALSRDAARLALSLELDEHAEAMAGPTLILLDLGAEAPVMRHVLDLPGNGRRCAFSPDGRTVAVGTTASQLVLIDFDSGRRRELSVEGDALSGAHAGRVVGVVMTDRCVLSVGDQEEGCDLKTWELATGREAAAALRLTGRADELLLSPDGRLVAVVTDEAGVHVRALPEGP